MSIIREIAPIVVSSAVIIGFVVVCSMLFSKVIPTESKELANIMFGGLVAMATTVVNYWLGSSAGSARKDNALVDKINNNNGNG